MAFSLTSVLPLPDMLALGWFFLCWVGYAYYADQRRWGTRELASVLHDYRLRWMTRVLERESRIADTVVLQTVMRSDKLFITTTLLIIAGLISSLGAVDWVQAGCRPGAGRVQAMVSGIGFIAVSSRETVELRILVLIGIFVFAFFKFTWSLRQFTHADAVRFGADAVHLRRATFALSLSKGDSRTVGGSTGSPRTAN